MDLNLAQAHLGAVWKWILSFSLSSSTIPEPVRVLKPSGPGCWLQLLLCRMLSDCYIVRFPKDWDTADSYCQRCRFSKFTGPRVHEAELLTTNNIPVIVVETQHLVYCISKHWSVIRVHRAIDFSGFDISVLVKNLCETRRENEGASKVLHSNLKLHLWLFPIARHLLQIAGLQAALNHDSTFWRCYLLSFLWYLACFWFDAKWIKQPWTSQTCVQREIVEHDHIPVNIHYLLFSHRSFSWAPGNESRASCWGHLYICYRSSTRLISASDWRTRNATPRQISVVLHITYASIDGGPAAITSQLHRFGIYRHPTRTIESLSWST